MKRQAEQTVMPAERLSARSFVVILGCAVTISIALQRQRLFAANPEVIEQVGRRIVKLYGAGGLGRLESYGSGFLVSPDGHILTLLSPLLEADAMTVVLFDGRHFVGKLLAVDNVRELAMVKIEGDGLPYFDLADATKAGPGEVVLAFSNQFKIAAGDEPVSVQQGVLAAIATLSARQGFHQFAYQGKVYIVDANTNNPGAAGGALTDAHGRLLGVIGKEVRSVQTETWVNYALPVDEFAAFSQSIIDGKGIGKTAVRLSAGDELRRVENVDLRGMVLLPDVLERTPAFLDGIRGDSPASQAGLKPDDLIVFVEESLIQSMQQLRSAMAELPADRPVKLVVLRDRKMLQIDLPPSRRRLEKEKTP